MIKIQKLDDLKLLNDKYAHNYIKNLLNYLFDTYNVDNIENLGVIIFVESKMDLTKYKALNLSLPLSEYIFEWIKDIGNGYINGCIVIDNDTAVNLVGKKKLFKDYITEE